MYKIKRAITFIACIFISFIFRNKKVFVVTGLRRSGNHAFINWFINALEGKETSLDYLDLDLYFGLSDTGKTVLLNEVNNIFNQANYFCVHKFLDCIRRHKKIIKKTTFIIISLEDYRPSSFDPFVPINAKKIVIMRSTLNLVASRLRRCLNQAKNGLDRGDMGITTDFVATLCWLYSAEKNGWNIWCYDSWLEGNKRYRSKFLSKFNLNYDKNPGISIHGSGSSFSSVREEVPDFKKASNRWQQINWPKRVLYLLKNEIDKTILSEKERLFIDSVIVDEER